VKDELIRSAVTNANNVILPRPPFTYSIGWAADYSSLFRREFLNVGDVNTLLDNAAMSGRVLLCGRGGSGKTTIFQMLLVSAAHKNMVPIFIDLKRWTGTDEAEWHALPKDPTPRIDFLLRRFSNVSASVFGLDALSTEHAKVLLFDGVNEVPSSIGNEIVIAADEIASVLINTCVLLSDRLVRRPRVREARWRFAFVEPLSEQSIHKAWIDANQDVSILTNATSTQRALLDSPFFLAEAINSGLSGFGSISAIESYLSRHGGPTSAELESVSSAAFEMYERYRGRTFPTAEFEALIGSELLEKLVHASTLSVNGDQAHFAHHLFHDFLAARFLARHPEKWTHASFNVVTLNASSFDAIALALGQIGIDSIDDFIVKIYDWNPYATAYALSEKDFRSETVISHELEEVILAMLAERRWDPILATAERSQDALSIFPGSDARAYLTAKSLKDVVTRVMRVKSSKKWFNEWRELFARTDGRASGADVNLISDENGILGWTAANVIKRLQLPSLERQRLRRIALHAPVAVRWRVAHVLGAFPDHKNVEFLLKLLASDKDDWVRYGAIRSIIEMAAKASPKLRREIFDWLSQHARLLTEKRRVLEEFSRTVIIDPKRAPKDWIQSLTPVIVSLMDQSSDVSSLDEWATLLQKLRATYGAAVGYA
jgi:hypothetical protein